MDLIEIFKVGAHTDSSGNVRDWTEQDLQEIASLYNPAVHEAPVVIGHPEMDSPAYGWVESLNAEGGKLLAKLKDIAPEFKDWVKRGLYKKVSVALYPDLGLRHIGFLGATPPAVKGLKQATFGEKPAAWEIETDFQYMEYLQQETVKSIFQRLRDWMIDKFSLEEADKVIGSYDIDALKPEPKEIPAVTQSFSSLRGIGPSGAESDDPTKGGKTMDVSKFFSDLKALIIGAEKELVPNNPAVKFTEADIQAAEKKGKDAVFAEVEKEKKEKEDALKKLKESEDQSLRLAAEKRKGDIASFCEGLCKDGKLTPALRKIIEPIMVAVSDQATPIEFSETVKKPALDGIKDFLTELPKVVTFKEVVVGDGPASGGSASEKLDALIKTKMKDKKDLSYSTAFAEVQRENTELAKEVLEDIRPKK